MDRKEQTLKLRLNDEMREWIERNANFAGVTMSEYIRGLIEDDMISARCQNR